MPGDVYPAGDAIVNGDPVGYNPSLPNCHAINLALRLQENGFTGTSEIDNNGTATCP